MDDQTDSEIEDPVFVADGVEFGPVKLKGVKVADATALILMIAMLLLFLIGTMLY